MNAFAKRSLAAAALGATALPLASIGVPAMSAAQPLPLAGKAPAVILTSGGCGPFAHRGFYGACRPNGFGYGFHRGYGYGYGFHRGYGFHHGYGFHRY